MLMYGLLLAGTLILSALMVRHTLRSERIARQVRDAACEAGLIEPPSLHPVVDPSLCIGCGTCTSACPEGTILGLIDGKAELIEPTHCIGHGACAASCAPQAIQLVFGTEQRGVDIPDVDPHFQTAVPGLFIAGELGGMGLIRNAIEQGRQALEAVVKQRGRAEGGETLDLMIVGAGPAGFSASLAALEKGLNFVTVEQETLGGTVSHYPRGKIVMTAPVHLPIVGKVKFGETTKEKLLGFWQEVEKNTGVSISYEERLESIDPCGDKFLIRTLKQTYACRSVLLAIGRRGTPRKLDVPGEDLSKVVYRLLDPEQYASRDLLVVGGGDSALEAACACANAGARVNLAYRSKAFSRAKLKNRDHVERLASDGKIRVWMSTEVQFIGADHVVLRTPAGEERIANDNVLICAGGVLPTPFLKSLGVRVETKFGQA